MPVVCLRGKTSGLLLLLLLLLLLPLIVDQALAGGDRCICATKAAKPQR